MPSDAATRRVVVAGAGAAGLATAITAARLNMPVTLVDPTLSGSVVRFAVDAGIFLVSVISILFRYPFTLQYALEVTDAETAKLPGFIRANYVITWAWAAAMALMMIGNAAMIYVPWLPFWGGLLVAFAARNSAVYFTNWCPQYVKAKYGAQ